MSDSQPPQEQKAPMAIERSLKESNETSSTWEDDETRATGILRALSVLTLGSLLAYAQWSAPVDWRGTIAENWTRWIWSSVVFNFLLPAGLAFLFFGQVLSYQSWLKDQKHNAWNFGWSWKNWRSHLRISLALWILMLPLLWVFSRQEEVRTQYASYLPPTNTPADWLILGATLILYMLCWEWFFRGFGLFGMAQGLGPALAIGLQALGFSLTHYGKDPIGSVPWEMVSSFGGGALLGIICWKERSFVPAFFTHALVHLSFAVLVKI